MKTVMMILMDILMKKGLRIMMVKQVKVYLWQPEFQGSGSCTRNTTNITVCDFFSILVEDNMLEDILKQTNLFA